MRKWRVVMNEALKHSTLPLDFDFGRLLKPISAESPCGEDLRYLNIYDQILEARREDDPNLPQGIWATTVKRADWQGVIRLCEDILIEKSKDLQVAAWLTEAYLQFDGLVGLAKGIQLMGVLAETYWDDVYPQIHDNDMDYRISPFEWINNKIIERIFLIPLSKNDNEVKQVHYGEWVLLSKNRQGRDFKTRWETFHNSVHASPLQHYEDILTGAKLSVEKILKVESFLFSKKAAPEGSLHKLRHQIEDLISFLENTITSKKPKNSTPRPDPSPTQRLQEPTFKEQTKESDSEAKNTQVENTVSNHEDKKEIITSDPRLLNQLNASPSTPHVSPVNLGNITSREEAYEYLRQAAAYLAITEPHNPGHYLVNKAISWANLSLGDVLQQLVKEPQFMGQALELLGLTTPPVAPVSSPQPVSMQPKNQPNFPKFQFEKSPHQNPTSFENPPFDETNS